MTKVSENNTERNGFMSYPTEKHAAAAGAAPGLLVGLTWGTKYQAIALGAAMTVLLTALGMKKLSNKKLTKEIRKEAQYTLGFLAGVAALSFGLVTLL